MGAHEWEPYVQYYTDDVVRYRDAKYKARQTHTSQNDWTPEATPALWERLQHQQQLSAPHFGSSEEWIDAARKRTEDFNYNGPRGPTTWVLAENGHIPRSAIVAGERTDGTQLYIARTFYEGGLHIGYASRHNAAIPYGGNEIPVSVYEVLLGDAHSIRWVSNLQSQDGVQPVEGGYENGGQPIYVAQTRIDDNILPAKAWDGVNGARVAHNGQEIYANEYNILAYS
ncbi:hypothetical protein FRC03_010743 [Tulasnella sp. 419]|nr:hypothetical protein FRC03_010743 [Tulasnella sp. 419]